jgi:hypothetical protein
MVTKETLEKDLADHIVAKDQQIANANAISGVIQYIQAKLKAMEEEPRILVPKLVPPSDMKR